MRPLCWWWLDYRKPDMPEGQASVTRHPLGVSHIYSNFWNRVLPEVGIDDATRESGVGRSFDLATGLFITENVISCEKM